MVFYTCSGCGEALKKNKVEKHVYTCRGCEYLTCIDCGKDFYEDEYKNHNQCITEDQKYSAKGTEFKPNKGDVKQQQWLQNIESVVSSSTNLSNKARDLISNLKNYDNIPRKRPKFLNFLKNSLRIFDMKLGEEVWEAFSAANQKETPVKLDAMETPKKTETSSSAGKENLGIVSAVKKEKKSAKTSKEKGKKHELVAGGDVSTESLLENDEKQTLVAETGKALAEVSVKKAKKHKLLSAGDDTSKMKKRTKSETSKKATGVESNPDDLEIEDHTKADTDCKSKVKKKKKKAKSREREDEASVCEQSHENELKSENAAKSDGAKSTSNVVIASETTPEKKLKKRKKSKKLNQDVIGKVTQDCRECDTSTTDASKLGSDGPTNDVDVQKPKKKKKKKLKDSDDKKKQESSNDSNDAVMKKKKTAHVYKDTIAIQSPDNSNDITLTELTPNDAMVERIKTKKRKNVGGEELKDAVGDNFKRDIPVSNKKKKKKHKVVESEKEVTLDR